MNGPTEAVEALAEEQENHDSERSSQRRGEAERLEHADPLTEARHERDLDRSGEAGRDGERRRKSAT